MVLDNSNNKEKQVAPEISGNEFLDAKPVRNSAVRWEKNQQGVILLVIPLKQPEEKGRKSIFSAFSPSSQEKKIQLDSMGSIIWELCDGEKTVKDIIQILNEKYGMGPSEAEISLNNYFIQLSKRGLIVLLVPKESNEHLGEAAEK
jgi:hypothetical protein